MIRTLLVDDEEAARDRLRRLLGAFDDVEVIGEAEDGEQAIESITEQQPDLVFLDIQMPGCKGTEVAASLRSPRPKIIFCTAYEEYAVDAFELHAVDYLLKPVSRARLAKTLDRVRTLGSPATDTETAAGSAAGEYPSRFLARRSSRFHVVPVEEIVYFTSEGGLTKLQSAEQHYWMQPSLSDLEARLDPERFHRISRGAIVSLEAVRQVLPESGGHGEAVLSNGDRLEISRRRFRELMARLADERG
jgi:two-component system LytT family response regulator